jgi:hypothetical protein
LITQSRAAAVSGEGCEDFELSAVFEKQGNGVVGLLGIHQGALITVYQLGAACCRLKDVEQGLVGYVVAKGIEIDFARAERHRWGAEQAAGAIQDPHRPQRRRNAADIFPYAKAGKQGDRFRQEGGRPSILTRRRRRDEGNAPSLGSGSQRSHGSGQAAADDGDIMMLLQFFDLSTCYRLPSG